MAVALVQADPSTLSVVGIWFSPKDFYYPEGTDLYFVTLGHQAMARQFPDLDWAEWADYLANSRPGTVWWEQTPIDGGEDMEAVFTRLRQLA